MPKRSKPRKPNANRIKQDVASVVSPKALRRKKTVRVASIAIVVALVATFLIGALASNPAKAAERDSAATSSSLEADPAAGDPSPVVAASAEPDTDGDGIPNNADSDIDGDGIINGIDPDIDGDGTPNVTDGDPAATNGRVVATPKPTSGFQLPELIPAEFQTPVGRGIIAVLILVAGAGIAVARRKHK